jgi:glycosyltransferase involved in cell wall biosynthesis
MEGSCLIPLNMNLGLIVNMISWSAQHIASIWRITPNIVFPPCNIVDLMLLENNAEALLRNNMMVDILSVGQIRPEKDHLKQIEIFAAVRRLSYEQGLNCRVLFLFSINLPFSMEQTT